MDSSGPAVPSICSICHGEPVNAVKLDCGHIFCFLCIKSTAETTGVCALCRADIGIEFNFKQHEILGPARLPSSRNGYYWFYQGYKGWWLFDAETNGALEEAYERGDSIVERFIAGNLYIIDLRNMTQNRRDDTRTRVIIRETLDSKNILGIAGLRPEDFDQILEIMKSAGTNIDI